MGVKSEFSTIVFYPVPNIVLSIYFLAGVIRANHLWLLAPSPPFPSSLILNTLHLHCLNTLHSKWISFLKCMPSDFSSLIQLKLQHFSSPVEVFVLDYMSNEYLKHHIAKVLGLFSWSFQTSNVSFLLFFFDFLF